MRKNLILALVVIVSMPIWSQKYPSSSYELSPNGLVLMKWLGEETVVDMNTDEVLKKVQKINRQAFEKNNFIESVTIGDNVKEIGSAAFNICSNLANVTIPDGVKKIPGRCFRATSISKIKLPNSIIEIDQYAFWGCRNLKTIVFGNAIEKIGAGAFRSASVEFISLPKSLKYIDNGAFSGLRGLQMFTIYASEPPVLLKHMDANFESETEVFQYINFRKVKLIVPKGSAQKYKDAEQWNQFKLVEEM